MMHLGHPSPASSSYRKVTAWEEVFNKHFKRFIIILIHFFIVQNVTDQIDSLAASMDITEYHDCYESQFLTNESLLTLMKSQLRREPRSKICYTFYAPWKHRKILEKSRKSKKIRTTWPPRKSNLHWWYSKIRLFPSKIIPLRSIMIYVSQ